MHRPNHGLDFVSAPSAEMAMGVLLDRLSPRDRHQIWASEENTENDLQHIMIRPLVPLTVLDFQDLRRSTFER